MNARLREAARRIRPLYWLVGAARFVRHRARLRAENRAYARSHAPHAPPPALRYRVHGAFDERVYLDAGRVIAESIVQAWRRHSADPSAAVLDFGCGPGRVATQVRSLVPSCELHGTDIDADAIAWARSHLGEVARFATNAPHPPLGYGNGRFDLVYTVSVFTHLDEAAQLAWLEELARVLKPGGLLIATVHGATSRASCSPTERAALDLRGFAHRIDRRGRFKLDGLPDSYQTTFHSRCYVERVWQRDFELIDYDEGGVAGHQDIAVLRKRGQA